MAAMHFLNFHEALFYYKEKIIEFIDLCMRK